MAISQYKKYIWLVDTIRSAGKISREEIDRRWARSRLNDNGESRIPDSTFFRYKNDIEEIFDIEILCDRTNGSLYYLADTGINSQVKQWLLSQFAISEALDTSRHLRNRILYEPIPEGTEFLPTLVNAMHDNKWLQVSHQRFDIQDIHSFLLAPLCLKVFKQRWYVLGFAQEIDGTPITTCDEPRLYALDRMKRAETTEKMFELPKNFDPQTYFTGFYGVFRGKQYKPELIRAHVTEDAAPFLRSLPLHHSQKEVETCLFEWFVAPTLDFIQQLRTFGSELEILAPNTLRKAFIDEAQNVLNRYKK